jgi:hypothetical protein
VPKILLCGDKENFLKRIGNRQVNIVGQIEFRGALERGEFKLIVNIDALKTIQLNPEDFQIFLNGREISFDELKKILDDTADYIVFENDGELAGRLNELYQLNLTERAITLKSFLKYVRDNFYSTTNAEFLTKNFTELGISRLLDTDNFLAKNDLFYVWLNPDIEIETVDKDSFAEKYPVVENLYSKIYSSLEDCRHKFFDALLLTAERSPEEFIDMLIETDGLSKNILTFVRKNSELEKFLTANENVFEKVSRFPAVNGNWFLLKKIVRADFACYVVTHKDAKLDTLPDGYKIIHAGHALAKEDFGYLGDDTGDNISRLNPYLNEITALYWMWKNTSHSIIGLNHYRRFFTADGENILSAREATEFLRGCDIIVVKGYFFLLTQTELKSLVCGNELNEYVEKIFRKYIACKQPDYLEAFDYVSSSYSEYLYEMFITRRSIFEAYCKWLFSFIIEATEEILATTNIAAINNPRKYRITGLISERLMTVWLIKNRLRIKTLPIIFRENI